MACVSGMAYYSATTGTVLGLGGCMIAWSELSQAKDIAEAEVQIDQDLIDQATDNLLNFTGTTQAGTVDGALSIENLQLGDSTALGLTATNGGTLTVSNITLGDNSTLTLNSEGVLNLSTATFDGGGTLALNYAGPTSTTLDTNFLNSSFTGTLAIMRGGYTLNVDHGLGVSCIQVNNTVSNSGAQLTL